MKYLISIIFLFSVLAAQSNQIKDFKQLMETLTSSGNVGVVIHYGKTRLLIDGEETEVQAAVGGLRINTFEHFAKGIVRNEKAFISTFKTELINHSHYGVVYNCVKLRIYEDDEIEITAQYIDPNKFEVKMDEKFVSEIKNANNNAGVYLYKN